MATATLSLNGAFNYPVDLQQSLICRDNVVVSGTFNQGNVDDGNTHVFISGTGCSADNGVKHGWVIGNESLLRAEYGFAFGYRASSNEANSFVWQGVSGSDTYYPSHGEGSFSINPSGGLSGFYIGNTSLDVHIKDAVEEYISTESITSTGSMRLSGDCEFGAATRFNGQVVVNGNLFINGDTELSANYTSATDVTIANVGYLKNNYLKLNGGTMTGPITSETGVLAKAINDGTLSVGAYSSNKNGGYVEFFNSGYSDDGDTSLGGAFKLVAARDANSSQLIGYPGGQLKWNSMNIVRGININGGTTAIADENGTISVNGITKAISVIGVTRNATSSGLVTLPNLTAKVKVNGTEYSANGSGLVTLPNLTAKVKVNGTEYSPSNGLITLPTLVKSAKYSNISITPTSSGVLDLGELVGCSAGGKVLSSRTDFSSVVTIKGQKSITLYNNNSTGSAATAYVHVEASDQSGGRLQLCVIHGDDSKRYVVAEMCDRGSEHDELLMWSGTIAYYDKLVLYYNISDTTRELPIRYTYVINDYWGEI